MTVSLQHEVLEKFAITSPELMKFAQMKPDFGYNGLGEFVYMRSYSRIRNDGEKERWYDTVKRVVEGTYRIQKTHIIRNGLYWNEDKAQRSAMKMFKYIFEMKFLPPGRGLWAMGTDIIEKKGLFEALNNCAFTSTENIGKSLTDFLKPFLFMMDASMLGAGVGFDVKGANKVRVLKPTGRIVNFLIPDSREGWVEALNILLRSYYKDPDSYEFHPKDKIVFRYNEIRPAGIPLTTFGGVSSGYEPLHEMLEGIRKILDTRAIQKNQWLSETDIADIMNIIGNCVVAGGIRRTAQIAFGSSEEFMNLKNAEINPGRVGWMHRSNNSIEAKWGTDYEQYKDNIVRNGEPGFFWLENAQKFGRMGTNKSEKLHLDGRAVGGNPCLEQTLEHMEMCCLVETFPDRCDSMEEYLDVLKYAYLYAKTVTLGRTQWTETNRVMLRNRRIGTSVSGVAQFIEARGMAQLQKWLDTGYKALTAYDETYSEWFAIPRSIKITSVKPSGTVSLLAGATPGIHYPISRYAKRRVRVGTHDPMYEFALQEGMHVEPELKRTEDGWVDSEDTAVVTFYIDTGVNKNNLSMWEQFEIAAFMQEWWADNQVSVTITFDPDKEAEDIARALSLYQFRLKGVSLLPSFNLEGEYKQLPIEPISYQDYYTLSGQWIHADTTGTIIWGHQPSADKFCTTDSCEWDEYKTGNV